MKRALTILSALAAIFLGAWTHGTGGSSCPYSGAPSTDGCAGANQNAMFLISNSGTLNGGTLGLGAANLKALANKSPIAWPSAHPQTWNLAAVDYPIGPDRTKAAAWKDPATNPITGCTFYGDGVFTPGGNTNGGSTLGCDGPTFAIDGYEFGPTGGHGCTTIRVRTTVFSWSVTNSHFVNDNTCADASAITTAFQNTNAKTINISNNLFDGKWSGYTGYIQNTATTTPTTYLLPTSDQQILLVGQSSGGPRIHYTLQTSSTPACTSSSPLVFYGPTFTAGDTQAKRGSNTYICIVAESGSGPFLAAQTASPNIANWGAAVITDTNTDATLQYNVYLNMPGILGSITPTTGSHVDRWSFVYGVNQAGSAHSAWYASTYANSGTPSSPTIVNRLEYSYNTSVFTETQIPGSGSTVFSNLMQQGYVFESNLVIDGNTVVTNAYNNAIPGYSQTIVGNAALYYASNGQINGTATITNNWIDAQGSVSCLTSDSQGPFVGSVSGTTLTVTDASQAVFYIGEYFAYGTGPYIVAQLTNTNASGYPYQEGTYQLSASQTTGSSSTWRVYDTGITNLVASNNNVLTRSLGSGTVVFDPYSQNWYGGACPDHG